MGTIPNARTSAPQFALSWLWGGVGVALGSHGGGFEVALGWLCSRNRLAISRLLGSLGVALGCLCTPESMPSICLLYGFVVALGVFAPPFEIGCWMFDVRCSMFRTANSPGSQRPRRLPDSPVFQESWLVPACCEPGRFAVVRLRGQWDRAVKVRFCAVKSCA